MDPERFGFLTALNADINIALGDGLRLGNLLGGEEVTGANTDNALDNALFTLNQYTASGQAGDGGAADLIEV